VQVKELTDLAKYSIGYPRGMAYSDLIRNEFEPKGYYSMEKVKLYPSYNEVLADLRNGNLDLAFMEEPVLMHYRKTAGVVLDSARAFTGFDQLGFAFAKGSKIRPEFDAYLKELGPDKVREVVDRWMK
jgi:polar amino acid transport system substrate-binding protein